MMQVSEISTSTLYDRDFQLWLQETIRQLKTNEWNALDRHNLIEELASMGRSEKRELKSRLIVLLVHLLKCKYQEDKRSKSWLSTIREQRRQITFLLTDSPSLKPLYLEILRECYDYAREDAAEETGLAIEIFPHKFPFTSEEVLNSDFLSQGEK
ncbi:MULTISPECIES: DUF29 domain-containing protein [Spirulina sp. CCY15215]|uniref:DUF29 domain-containing protein n=1 Tax=Spirulina sp. CCY15215 TaxID=2767591 RepID=UPI001EF22FE2|nr:DUF29 domain-containing protein [Spirulina major]